MSKRRCKTIIFIIVLVIVLPFLSCEKREFRKYFFVKKAYDGFSVFARLDGTYYTGEVKAVAAPYSLFISITPKEDIDIKVTDLRLIDPNHHTVMNENQPVVKKEKMNRKPAGYFYCITTTNLNIAYVVYQFEFDVQFGDRDSIKIDGKFEKNYSEDISSDWWDAISGI
ncbi:MAG: hypothetical protein JXM79_18735 [Sedimentisphaerales bacterium]|nr:hypothetical protein [Sedimentisphaerales bacterium]